MWVALDMSGSITDAEFTNALEQVLQIVHAYNHRITIVECDNEVRRTHIMETVKDVNHDSMCVGQQPFHLYFL